MAEEPVSPDTAANGKGADADSSADSSADSTADLGSYRSEINSIDDKILSLLARRRETVRAVIQTKIQEDRPLRDPDREADLLDRLIRSGRENELDAHFVTRVYQAIIEDSVRYQESVLQDNVEDDTHERISVAYQGVEGAYSDLAAKKFFHKRPGARFEGYTSFEDVVAAVENGQANRGMLPIENTTAGSINSVYQLLQTTKLKIVGEEVFDVAHCLLAPKEVPVSKIERVYSHYQALAQCSDFLGRLSNCSAENYLDTADAAKKVAKDNDPAQAAIASAEAGEIYGLKILKRNLANQPINQTRFVVVAKSECEVDPRVPCKTSLVMSTQHQEGALLKALSILHKFQLNLTKLESHPVPGSPFAYMFYLDFECEPDDPTARKAIQQLMAATLGIKVLGTYPRYRHQPTKPNLESKLATIPRSTASPDARVDVEPGDPSDPTDSDGLVLDPDRLVSRGIKSEDTRLLVREAEFGGDDIVVIAGPRREVSAEAFRACAQEVSNQGGGVLRAGCLEKAKSSFHSRRVDTDALERLATAGHEFGLPVVTVVESVADVEHVARVSDMIEIGARNMQNFGLLEEVGSTGSPVLLTRGNTASLEEFLDAAECILAQGNQQVLLCERGVHTADAESRTTLDLGTFETLRRLTHLPLIADPCHAVARESLIAPLTRAAQSFGAHAVVLYLRPNDEAPDDSQPRSLDSTGFAQLVRALFAKE